MEQQSAGFGGGRQRKFGAITTLKQLEEEWGWYYVMRQKGSHLVCSRQFQQQWQPLGELIERRGEKVWLEGALLSRLHAHQMNLVLYWKRGEKEPWLLATNLPNSKLDFSHLASEGR